MRWWGLKCQALHTCQVFHLCNQLTWIWKEPCFPEGLKNRHKQQPVNRQHDLQMSYTTLIWCVLPSCQWGDKAPAAASSRLSPCLVHWLLVAWLLVPFLEMQHHFTVVENQKKKNPSYETAKQHFSSHQYH